MTTKTEWLDWLEASADRLQERYRQAWTRLPSRGRRHESSGPAEQPGKPWCAIHPQIDREPREVVVHLELPEPHTVEADVRVIGQTLAIAVLRSGSGIEEARVEDCYRRAIPLPPRVDPDSAVHKIHGDELVIRMQPKTARRRSSRSGGSRRKQAEGSLAEKAAEEAVQPAKAGGPEPRSSKQRPRKRAGQGSTASPPAAQVTELRVGSGRRNQPGGTRS